MSEWWTYTLSDFLLFSPRTYYRLFELYNAEIWPAQLVAFAFAVAALGLLRSRREGRTGIVAAILAACWLWVAWAFHWRHYATINWAATYFAGAFAFEALLLVVLGLVRNDLALRSASSPRLGIGFGVIVFALLVHPLIGPLVGRGWMQLEGFGVAPDPTVVATLGFLLAAGGRTSWMLWVIPLLWCALSGAVAWTMGSPDALLMPTVAIAVSLCAWRTRARTT